MEPRIDTCGGANAPRLTDLLRSARLFCPAGTVVELRAPKAGRLKVVSGYFDDPEALAREAARWEASVPGVYVTMNPTNPALLARSVNKAKGYAEATTSDNDVLARRFLLIDADPQRPAGISSSAEEHEAAHARARAIAAHLTAQGWPAPVYADSGNGAHLLYRIDIPNDAGALALVNNCLEALAARFDDPAVNVDRKVGNAARITKLYGTLTKKGEDTPTRPHRRSHIIELPEDLESVSLALLVELAEEVKKPAPAAKAPTKPGGILLSASFDIEAFIANHGIEVKREQPYQGGRKWLLEVCPWNPDHTDNAAWIVQWPNGALAAGCSHNSCTGKDWHALRALFSPRTADVLLRAPLPKAAPAPRVEVEEDTDDEPPRWRRYSLDDIADLPPVPWLVEGAIKAKSLVMVNGESNIGKSFVVLDMALSIATGRAWAKRSTKPGRVLYVCLEGSLQDTYARADAWRAARDHEGPLDAIEIVEEIVQLDSPAEVTAFAETLKEGEPLALVIFDTLALSVPGADENDAKDANRIVGNLRWLKSELGATVMIVHHSKKDDPSTERGSSAFRGAMDTQIVVKRSGDGFGIECVKQRGAEKFKWSSWKLDLVEGTGCVVPVLTSEDSKGGQASPAPRPLTHQQTLALRCIQEATLEKGGISLSELGRRMEASNGTAGRLRDALLVRRFILRDEATGLLHAGRTHQADSNSSLQFDADPCLTDGEECGAETQPGVRRGSANLARPDSGQGSESSEGSAKGPQGSANHKTTQGPQGSAPVRTPTGCADGADPADPPHGNLGEEDLEIGELS